MREEKKKGQFSYHKPEWFLAQRTLFWLKKGDIIRSLNIMFPKKCWVLFSTSFYSHQGSFYQDLNYGNIWLRDILEDRPLDFYAIGPGFLSNQYLLSLLSHGSWPGADSPSSILIPPPRTTQPNWVWNYLHHFSVLLKGRTEICVSLPCENQSCHICSGLCSLLSP